MKTLFSTLLFFTIGLTSFAQVIFGSGNVTETTRSFKGITSLEIKGHFIVELVQGNKEELTIKTDDNMHQYVLTELKDGKLSISLQKGKYKKVKSKVLTLYYKDLSSITNLGSGDINTKNQLSTGTLNVNLVGSGDVDLNLSVTELNVDVSGSGDVDLLGNTLKLNITQFGSGDVRAYNLQAQDVTVNKTGSGNARVVANSSLTGNVAGSGDLMYKGNATASVSANGSGEVLKEH